MPEIPPEVVPLLDDLGLLDSSNSRWKKEYPCPLSFPCSHFQCACGSEKWGHRVDLAKVRFKSAVVFIGQCDLCHTIYWRPALEDFMFAAGAAPDMHEKILAERLKLEEGT